MTRRPIVLLALLVLALAPRVHATELPAAPAVEDLFVPAPSAAPVAPEILSAFAQPVVSEGLEASPALFGRGRGAKKPGREKPAYEGMPLGAERARILLRSLAVPGWGQATLGRRHAAATFAVVEAGIWGAFTSFRVQEQMRRNTYERTARLFAGIDLKGRDDEYRRIVGAFVSSDEYNLLVVSRDAANLYMQDPAKADMVAYHQYIAEHSIGGSDAWHWNDLESFSRYRGQRKDAQRASLRANTVLGLAVANRIVSALHATRAAGRLRPAATTPASWNFDVTPGEPGGPVAFRAGVRATF